MPQAVSPISPDERRRSRRLAWLLFLLTFATTTLAGASLAGADWLRDLRAAREGLTFSLTLLAILLAHELGHYVASREYGVDTSPPYFIPVPPLLSFIGTFGAFIRMRSPPRDRRALFDIAVAGPWAGFLLSVPAIHAGLLLSPVKPVLEKGQQGLLLGDNLVFKALAALLLDVPEGYDVYLHPIAFAGWIGLFVTSLNLLPIGQLDGGHVSYALLGRRAAAVSRWMTGGLLLLGVLSPWKGWLVWAALALFFRLGHPETADDRAPLGAARTALGWLTALLFAVCFTPAPFKLAGM